MPGIRRLVLLSAAAVAWSFGAPASGLAQTKIKFLLDGAADGRHAAYFVSRARGFYKAERLSVTVDAGADTRSGIGRVGKGEYAFALVDLGALIYFRARNPGRTVKAVLVVNDASPYSIVTLGRTRISKMEDLVGRTLATSGSDDIGRFWNILARHKGIDPKLVVIKKVGAGVREAMLAAGQVDAITGVSFSSFIKLRSKGVPKRRIKVLQLSRHGLDLFGSAVVVDPALAKRSPRTVRRFVSATIKGWQATLRHPPSAVAHVVDANASLARNLELERLQRVIADNVRTAFVKRNGFGSADEARLERSIDLIAAARGLRRTAVPGDVFTDAFLPPRSERMLP